jgi:hypothetical protein
MSHSPKSLLLDEEIELLVRHFGVRKVRAALAKVSTAGEMTPPKPILQTVLRNQKPIRTTVVKALGSIRETSPDKHRLLTEFWSRLKDRQILPESQDIRHFAQLVGLKDISGKSRKDMIPKLMRFLLEQPVDRLRIDIQSADNISEQQREEGFSILADKLLGKS